MRKKKRSPKPASKAARKVGRPRTGKRSNPQYGQHSIWLPGALYAEVSKRLIRPDGTRREFSALVETLLTKWIERDNRTF